MNLLKNKIFCLNCGKKYNRKNNHGQYILLCSGRNNYGVKFCHSKIIKEKNLIEIINYHCKIYNKKEIDIDKIEVNIFGEVKIKYKDGKISKWSSDKLIY